MVRNDSAENRQPLALFEGSFLTLEKGVATPDVRSCEKQGPSTVTFMQATPVTWWLLLGAGWRGKSSLQIVCTGEAMPRELAELDPLVRRLWNLYGPTETTIWSTGYQVENGESRVPFPWKVLTTAANPRRAVWLVLATLELRASAPGAHLNLGVND